MAVFRYPNMEREYTMKKILAVLLLSLLLLSGCTTQEMPPAETEPPVTIPEEDFLNPRRSMLSDEDKAVYDMIKEYALSYTPFFFDFRTGDLDFDTYWKVDRALCYDNPEMWLFYSVILDYDHDSCDETGMPSVWYSVKSDYFLWETYLQNANDRAFDRERHIAYVERINARCDEIIAEMPEGLSTREQYVWLADYLCDHTEPDHVGELKYIYADGPLLYGKGICQSYTQAYQWLCQRAGLWIMTCNGTGAGTAHGWNIVMPEPEVTYYMDITWADSSGNRDLYYFMTYEICISTGHTIDEGEWIANGN